MLFEPGLESTRTAFLDAFTGPSADSLRIYRAPGRINIIGEHTDYNGGLVFPATIDLYTWVAARPRDDRQLNVLDAATGQRHHLELDRLERGEKGQPAEYFKGVAWALQSGGMDMSGCDIAISGNIPLGGGLSSSASLELALALALADCSGVADPDRSALAINCQRAESEFVGAQCGIMDQYVIALGAQGRAMMLDCRSLAFDLVEIPPALAFLVVHSGVSHRVSTGSYNTRREECERALRLLRARIPDLGFLSDLTSAQLDECSDFLEETLYRRCRHVLHENRRVREAGAAMRGPDKPRLGDLLCQSHASLRDDFQVSCEELDRLVEIAVAQEGVYGSRMMGGGFGGCTITLVDAAAAEDTAARISEAHARQTGRKPWMHIAATAEAVKRVA
jgi:galactokinase